MCVVVAGVIWPRSSGSSSSASSQLLSRRPQSGSSSSPAFPPSFYISFCSCVCLWRERKSRKRERENALMRLLLLCSHVSKLFLVGTGEFKADIHRTTFSITFSSFNNFCVMFFCGEWWPTPHSLVLHIFLFLSCSLFTFTVKLNNHFHT